MANEPSPLPAPQESPPAPPPAIPAGAPQLNLRGVSNSIVVYRHSALFYWWPVWAFGFLFAAISYFGDYHMAIVPAGAKTATVDVAGVQHDAILLKPGTTHVTRKDDAGNAVPVEPRIFVTRYRALGAIFLFVLLLVIFITNVTLRGLWSVVAMIVLISLVVIFYLAGYWETIFERLGNLSIFINLGGYVMISLVVFVLWLLTFFVFDKQLYVVFTPGQMRLCLEIGMGETIYDTIGMTVQKTRSDLFRHKVLGFGSGDIVLRFPRKDTPIELHNVLNVNRVLKRVEQLTKEKIVVGDKSPRT